MKTFALLLGLLGSTQVLAHPGHDHAFWMSDAIHAVTVLAIIAIVAVAVKALRKSSNHQHIEEK